MDLDRIRYFICLAEQLHFGRAAELLYISQSSLSYHISELERELDVQLFVRGKRKVLLTTAGVKLLPFAKAFQLSGEQLLSAASSSKLSDNSPQALQICFDASFERFDLLGIPQAIADLREQNPNLNISISLHQFQDLMEKTERMDCDIGFGILRDQESVQDTMNILPLYEDYLAVVHNQAAQTDEDLPRLLRDNPLYLIHSDPRWTSYIQNVVNTLGWTCSVKLLDNFSDILTHVYFGNGITILPDTQCRAESITRPGLQCIPIRRPACLLRTCAFWAKGNYNYAITLLLAGIRISPEVLSLFD